MCRTTASSSGLASTGQSTTVVTAPRRTTTIRFDRPISSSSDSERSSTAAPPDGEGTNRRVELLPGGDVDASGRIVQHEDAAPAVEPAGEDELLLVAAAQLAGEHPRRRHLHAHPLDQAPHGPSLTTRADQAHDRPAEVVEHADRHVVAGRRRGEDRVGRTFGRHVQHTVHDRPMHRPPPYRPTEHPELTRVETAGSGDRRGDVRCARPDHAGEADDLTGSDGEIDVGEGAVDARPDQLGGRCEVGVDHLLVGLPVVVGVAHATHHQLVQPAVVDAFVGEVVDDDAVLQHDDPRAGAPHVAQHVRHVHERRPVAPSLDEREQHLRLAPAERAGRLVEQDHGALAAQLGRDERLGDLDELAFGEREAHRRERQRGSS